MMTITLRAPLQDSVLNFPLEVHGARSVMVIIGASQALDPGSIPGERRSGH